MQYSISSTLVSKMLRPGWSENWTLRFAYLRLVQTVNLPRLVTVKVRCCKIGTNYHFWSNLALCDSSCDLRIVRTRFHTSVKIILFQYQISVKSATSIFRMHFSVKSGNYRPLHNLSRGRSSSIIIIESPSYWRPRTFQNMCPFFSSHSSAIMRAKREPKVQDNFHVSSWPQWWIL